MELQRVGTGFKQGGPWDVEKGVDWVSRGDPSINVRSMISFFRSMYEYLLMIPTPIPPIPGTGSEGWARFFFVEIESRVNREK